MASEEGRPGQDDKDHDGDGHQLRVPKRQAQKVHRDSEASEHR
jgi:hypothetical protein